MRSTKSKVAGEENRISSLPARSVLGLRTVSTQASRNQVQSRGKEELLHATGLGKSFPQDTTMLKMYMTSRGVWSSTWKRNPLKISKYIEPCLTQKIS